MGTNTDSPVKTVGVSIDSPTANKLATILKDTLGVVISPLKKITESKSDLYIEKMRAKHKFKLEKVDLVERAKLRLFESEVRRQYNLEKIGEKTLDYMEETANPPEIDIDWLHHFSHSAQDVSEEKVRDWWAKILAGEAKQKGSFSRRTIDVLKNLSKEDCELFEKFSQYVVRSQESSHHFYIRDMDYSSFGGEMFTTEHLKLCHMGTIMMGSSLTFTLKPNDKYMFHYSGKKSIIENKSEEDILFSIYTLTEAGSQLLKVANTQNIQFADTLKNYLIKLGLTYTDIT